MSDDAKNDGGSNDFQGGDRGLTADLAALRGALREVCASDADERRLIGALRARRATPEAVLARAAAGASQPGPIAPAARATHGRAWRVPVALAAAAVLAAVAAVLTLDVERADDALLPASTAAGAAPSAAAPRSSSFAGAFQPLAFSSGLSPSQSYSVVRVRIPLTALAPGQSAPPDATIEADVLVGEDGLAHGIRFNKADTLFVSTASNEMGERR